MTLPSPLNTLLPNALDVLRYYLSSGRSTATIDDICQDVGLSERGFGKAIRSLVTRGYVIMDGNQIYRLTDKGGEALELLLQYDDEGNISSPPTLSSHTVTRRLVALLPNPLTAGQSTTVHLGLAPAEDMDFSAEVVLRVTIINGQPDTPQEIVLSAGAAPATTHITITPDAYTMLRLRLEAYQTGANPDAIAVAGGMYIDANISAEATDSPLTAYGTDITLDPAL